LLDKKFLLEQKDVSFGTSFSTALALFICMKQQEKDQIYTIISNYADQYKKVPFVSDLLDHAMFGPIFSQLSEKDIATVRSIINQFVEEKLMTFSTKWWELFRRFYEVHTDIFWQFRKLNADKKTASTKEFQTVWKQVEQELFTYEGILTEKMLNRPEGLDKTIDAFYDIVYMFFPCYNQID